MGEIDYRAIGQAAFRLMPLRPMPEDVGRAVVAAYEQQLREQGFSVASTADIAEALDWANTVEIRKVDWIESSDGPVRARLAALVAAPESAEEGTDG